MTNSPVGTGKGFHEMPLVLFTALAMTAGGIGVGRLVLAVLGAGGWRARPPQRRPQWWGSWPLVSPSPPLISGALPGQGRPSGVREGVPSAMR